MFGGQRRANRTSISDRAGGNVPELQIKKAIRRALPMQIGFYGPSGSGKTLSALLFASGLIKPNGRIIVVDTERGRASIHADSPLLMKALPQGYDVVELDQPYHPSRFIDAVKLCEKEKYDLTIVDSESDSWDGPGGCFDIAEEDGKGKDGKGRGLVWNNAKRWNKKYKVHIALSDMHVISLFKAQEKTKIIDKAKSESGRQEYVDLGVLPIGEKNAFYPLLVGFSIDPVTHLATLKKGSHENIISMWPQPKLITKQDGEILRKWNESAKPLEADEQLKKRATYAADDGLAAYEKFFKELSKQERVILQDFHQGYKQQAEEADKLLASREAGSAG
jgi:hypothetical protein